ncbi:MAG: mannose-1-phosphate guanylyltransferase/mannose-6-phosphate isomerase [Pseudomonadales bacterium]
MIIPVLLSGGVGSRLWPISRQLYPKQFLPLVDDGVSLLQATHARTIPVGGHSPIVVCNEEHRFLVAEQLKTAGVRSMDIILEPCGRNTAPAAALAAMCAVERDENALMLLLPADHAIAMPEAFVEAVEAGESRATKGDLVTFGISPEAPETGYGYIHASAADASGCCAIKQFVEKPDLQTAEQYLAKGDYYWNSGMFLFSAAKYLEELEKHAPELLKQSKAAYDASIRDLDFIRVNEEEFAACPSDSIDYAVMEHTDNGVMIPLDCGWSDVGSWTSLWDIGERDADNNVSRGDVILEDVSNSYIHSESRLTAALGVSDVVIVETPDAILVAEKSKVQNIKLLVNQLKDTQREEAEAHTRVYRPWGSYESLVNADRFQVKRIIVNPGQTLSLQMHHHRAEHWIVVKGSATVTCGEEEFILGEDQSTYIPLGNKHRLANPGVIPLELIEVQTGSYLGEDDIVRFEDVYGR